MISLVITSTDSVPVVIMDGVVFSREDVMTSHEEADVIIIQQMVNLRQLKVV